MESEVGPDARSAQDPRERVAPVATSMRALRPRDRAGWLFLAIVSASTALAAWLALAGGWETWLAGQLVFALVFVQWFVLLHEAGHRTLFRTRALNVFAGRVAGFFALIPYASWQRIHARHHRWTGWQDLDATTASLVPRTLAPWERWTLDWAWKTGLPLFSTLYRLSNYWNVRRISAYLHPADRRSVRRSVVAYACAYVALAIVAGPDRVVACCGLGCLLALAIEDPLLLSQHTHLALRVSAGAIVRPLTPFAQQAYTRSLRLPRWLSWLVLHFDAHELHHMYVRVPGYDLARIPFRPANEVDWWTWLRGAKRLRGSVFLFQNRTQTGFRL